MAILENFFDTFENFQSCFNSASFRIEVTSILILFLKGVDRIVKITLPIHKLPPEILWETLVKVAKIQPKMSTGGSACHLSQTAVLEKGKGILN